MGQTLDVKIKIPEDYVLITKSDHESFIKENLVGRTWSMKQLEERTNRSALWLRQHILEIPEFREELEEFVSFPEKQGQPWKFGALRMSRWLEENQELIFGR